MALDNDQAGRKAVFADAEILLPLGFTLRVVTWPNAKDADEVLKGQGGEVIQKAVEDSVDFFEFAFRNAVEKYDISNPAGKAHVASEVIDRIQKLDSTAARDAYLEWLAEKLGLSVESLRGDLTRRLEDADRREQYQKRREAERENQKAAAQQAGSAQDSGKKKFSERTVGVHSAFVDLLKLVLQDESLAKSAAHDIEEGICDDTPLGRALDLTMAFALSGEWKDASSRILTEIAKDGSDISMISGMLTSLEQPSGDGEAETAEVQMRQRLYQDCVRRIRLEYCRQRLEDLSQEAEKLSDDDPEKLV